ncbi:hypothetical protein JCM21900_006227 [Sporobolomyces salmonicolor]
MHRPRSNAFHNEYRAQGPYSATQPPRGPAERSAPPPPPPSQGQPISVPQEGARHYHQRHYLSSPQKSVLSNGYRGPSIGPYSRGRSWGGDGGPKGGYGSGGNSLNPPPGRSQMRNDDYDPIALSGPSRLPASDFDRSLRDNKSLFQRRKERDAEQAAKAADERQRKEKELHVLEEVRKVKDEDERVRVDQVAARSKREEQEQIAERKRARPSGSSLKSSMPMVPKTAGPIALAVEKAKKSDEKGTATGQSPNPFNTWGRIRIKSDHWKKGHDDAAIDIRSSKPGEKDKGKSKAHERYEETSAADASEAPATSDSKSTGMLAKFRRGKGGFDDDALSSGKQVIDLLGEDSPGKRPPSDHKKKRDDKHLDGVASPPTSPPRDTSPSLEQLYAQQREEEIAEVDQREEQIGTAERRSGEDDEGYFSDSQMLFDNGERRDNLLEKVRGAQEQRREDSPDPLLENDFETVDPTTLCPFCDQPLPETPSSRLVSLRKYLLARPHLEKRVSVRNNLAKKLPIAETASFCRMHKDERTVIPEGKARGYPTEIAWNELPKRIDRELSGHLTSVILGQTASHYLDCAKKEWDEKGRQMRNVASEFGSFHNEEPGYYGPRGFECMMTTLTTLFTATNPLLTPLRVTPLSVQAYVRRVLVPECAVELIRRDLGPSSGSDVSREEAERVCAESRAYGKAVFGVLSAEDEAEFAMAREREEREVKERIAEKAKERARVKGEPANLSVMAVEASDEVDSEEPKTTTTAKAYRKPKALAQLEQEPSSSKLASTKKRRRDPSSDGDSAAHRKKPSSKAQERRHLLDSAPSSPSSDDPRPPSPSAAKRRPDPCPRRPASAPPPPLQLKKPALAHEHTDLSASAPRSRLLAHKLAAAVAAAASDDSDLEEIETNVRAKNHADRQAREQADRKNKNTKNQREKGAVGSASKGD